MGERIWDKYMEGCYKLVRVLPPVLALPILLVTAAIAVLLCLLVVPIKRWEP